MRSGTPTPKLLSMADGSLPTTEALLHIQDPHSVAMPTPWLADHRAAVLAAGQVVAACSPFRADVVVLARRSSCEKWVDQFSTLQM